MGIGNVRHKQILIVRQKGVLIYVGRLGRMPLIEVCLHLPDQIGDNSNEKIDPGLFHQLETGRNGMNRTSVHGVGGSGFHLGWQGSWFESLNDNRHAYSPALGGRLSYKMGYLTHLDIFLERVVSLFSRGDDFGSEHLYSARFS